MKLAELEAKWIAKARQQFNEFAALSEDGVLGAEEAGQLVGKLIAEALREYATTKPTGK